jgi:perosamine synthetase
LRVNPEVEHGYHLYVVQLDLNELAAGRERIFAALRAEGIGVNVHYLPVHLHPYYQERFNTRPGQCPRAEATYEKIVSLPLFASMTDADVDDVIEAMGKVVHGYALEARAAAVAVAR